MYRLSYLWLQFSLYKMGQTSKFSSKTYKDHFYHRNWCCWNLSPQTKIGYKRLRGHLCCSKMHFSYAKFSKFSNETSFKVWWCLRKKIFHVEAEKYISKISHSYFFQKNIDFQRVAVKWPTLAHLKTNSELKFYVIPIR